MSTLSKDAIEAAKNAVIDDHYKRYGMQYHLFDIENVWEGVECKNAKHYEMVADFIAGTEQLVAMCLITQRNIARATCIMYFVVMDGEKPTRIAFVRSRLESDIILKIERVAL